MIVKNVPYYIQVADTLRNELKSGTYTAYSEFPDIMTLAERFGVSIDVIRQSRKILCSEGLIKTVKGKGTYVMDLTPQNHGYTLHLNTFHSPFHSTPILRAVQDLALENNLTFSVHFTDAFDLERERNIIEKTIDNNCRLMVSSPSLTYKNEDNSSLYKKVVNQGIPLILIDRYVKDTGADLIYFDNETTAYNMIKDLGNCDPQSMFILISQGYRVSDERAKGLLAGQKEFFPSMPVRNIYNTSSKWFEKKDIVAETMYYIKKNKIMPEVLITVSEQIAFEIFNSLRKEKLHRSLKKIISIADSYYGDSEFNAVHLGYYRMFDELANVLNSVISMRLNNEQNSSPIIKPLACRPLTGTQAEKHFYQHFNLGE